MYQPVRGTKDVIGLEKRQKEMLLSLARQISGRYFFQEIETPIFESTDVFHRLGATSDVISKETYTFQDRGGDSLTLRPEGTAAVVRALISNGLTQEMPGKYFYTGPMFRYERPQKGRYRQHTQIGVELFGVNHAFGDVEIIALAQDLLNAFDLEGDISLELNTLGDGESRSSYRQALVDYLSPYTKELTSDSQRRLLENPLRILDSKEEQDHKILENAPPYRQFLNAESRTFFEGVCQGLNDLGIKYHLNDRLVRGLDYYCHTTFEFKTNALGAQGTVLAGGRYDGLVAQMGGPDVAGVGFAAGVERLMLLSGLKPEILHPVALIPLGDESMSHALKLAHTIRQSGFCAELILSGNIGKRMKKADKMGASHALILGDEEIKSGLYALKNLANGQEIKVSKDELIKALGQ